jgi:hypothetical protein
MMTCTGTLLLHDQAVIVLMCSEPADHPGDHFDPVFSYRWRRDAVVGTCHLPPVQGVEVVE